MLFVLLRIVLWGGGACRKEGRVESHSTSVFSYLARRLDCTYMDVPSAPGVHECNASSTHSYMYSMYRLSNATASAM